MDTSLSHHHADTLDDFVTILRANNVKITPQRIRIITFALKQKNGFSLNNAVVKMKPYGIGQATVYRTIDILISLGLLREITKISGEKILRLMCPGHHHTLICSSCGKILEFDSCGMQLLEELLTLQTGFKIESHYMEVYGTCESCQNK